jgi:hypothetical protein
VTVVMLTGAHSLRFGPHFAPAFRIIQVGQDV